MQEYYRVLGFNTTRQLNYDTLLTNYGDGFDSAEYHYFMRVYADVMAQINLPVDFLISVSNQICDMGEDYLSILNNSVDDSGLLHLFQVSQNQKHQGFTIPVELMFDFLQSFDEENQFIYFMNGTMLWEYYLEKVRNEEFNHLPARLKSVFFFNDINTCNDYKTKHLNGIGSTFAVEISETTSVFEGDMSIIDELNGSISRDELLEQSRKYWRGEKTENPISEIIFQGKYNLVEL